MTTMTVLHDNVVDVVYAPVRLALGVELLGEYTDSGFSRPQYLLRRPDGQVVLVSQLLYLVAAALRHHDRLGAVARVVGEQLDRGITAADVDHLISTQLRPAGVLAAYGDRLVVVPPANPSRGLSLRVGAVPPPLHSALTRALRPLFHLAVVANVLTVMLLVDVWLVSHPGALLDAWVHVAARLPLVLGVAGLMIATLAFHELGRASACRFGGGRPGPMNVGVRIAWPAVHTDVTDAYRLDRRGRLRTHLGGVYFDVVFALALAAGYAATGSQALLAALVLAQVHAVYQLLPFARLDGYHILNDLSGVPNLFAYLPAATTTLLPLRGAPRRRASHTLDALTPPARTALRAWVALSVAVVALAVAVAAYLAPPTLAQLGRTIRTTAEQLGAAAGDGRWTAAARPALQLTLLAVLVLGWAVLVGHAAGRGLTAAARPLARTQLPARLALPAVAAVAVLLAAVAGIAVGRLNPSDPDPTVPLAAATTTPPAPRPATATTAATAPTTLPTPDPAPAPRPATATTAATAPTAVGPSEGGANGPTAPPANPTPTPAPALRPDPPASAALTWTVQPGDNLWTIADHVQSQTTGRTPTEQETTAYWSLLRDANHAPLAGSDLLYTGQTLTLPAAVNPQPAQTDETGPAATWTVQPGDNLWTIAHHVQSQTTGQTPTEQETARYWTTLVAANRTTLADPDNPDLLFAGQDIHLPPTS